MHASYNWIRDYLPEWNGTSEEMADKLTLSGTEVESGEPNGDDVIFDIGITSNRPDSLCHHGLAREVSALTGTPIKDPACEASHDGGPTSDVASVTVEDADGCPRFTARVIEGIKVGPSPDWLRNRLEVLGMRSVNNVVDVTNFVLHEMNQPLHAYDLDKLADSAIVVRRAAKGEKLKAINGTTYELDPADLVICDSRGPVGLAGVMGGLDTEVGDGTTRILMESASFHAPSVRQTSRRHALSSDASYRFERGCDRHGALRASERACRLILELCGGTLRSEPIDVGGDGPAPEPVTLRHSRVTKVCGIEVPPDRVIAILQALECRVEADGDTLHVTPPTFRADLAREIDLVEEIIRCYGLDHLPVEAGMPIKPVPEHPVRAFRERAKDRMVALGYLETVTPDFVREGPPAEAAFLIEGDGLVVRNPVRKGEGALRRTLLPSLLTVRKHNQDHGNDDVRIFEVSNVRAAPKGDVDVPHKGLLAWMTDGDYRDARGTAESLLHHLGIDMTVVPFESSWLENGTSGQITSNGRVIGVIGQPGKRLIKDVGLKVKPTFGELDLDTARELASGPRRFSGMARFPGIVRDLAIIVADGRPYGDIEALVAEAKLAWLERMELFDVFRGKQVGQGKKSLAIRLAFRSPEGTLTSDQVDAEMGRLMTLLKERLDAEIRGSSAS